MNGQYEEAKKKAKDTYNAAADCFDDGPLSFWAKYGRKTVERLSLPAGASVLDAACGTGASAIPAGEIVGPTGKVRGIDISENMLELARRKADVLGLSNTEFVLGDMSDLPYSDESFDAVVCVFGVFFIPDMETQVEKLWRLVKPGGKLAITTWGQDLFKPVYEQWKNAIKDAKPELYSAFNPWDRISEPDSLHKLMEDAGTTNIEIACEEGVQELTRPEDWWTIALGSGLRWTIDRLSEQERNEVRDLNLSWIERNNVVEVETNVIYAVATKDF